ncbi:FAD-dependent oxidoreductase [Mesomycoplasma ovipneumoniae]|uniref:FAD-dependent oxidoreductase n=1 Tax=Mesomycoplasma ovipneumoniae TaxID=29562 RepID=A0AAP5Y2Q6_9BACT|nr:FAD-dependent oxidoreductase [Mesomycoplasma ovipneumoniae]MDW2906908.1 FAD-dependent oxidoreductase [Mesomycoplasma ovipneumoniae]MDW2911866.1 FAD-dependent oxidoreductase [Mesomycoplasma ovipneumoniae]MDW2916547.1 FAD-dependent oxidoreductase [Mesomycoplasma ovipneumoniae]MDW2916825.1 FAD-dependent oxidoreductase [Mesomycoplasma ovipneumoniae]MDW2919869.1 FAD-dependent oxidoreductase [Mesomycoplasma ovipneumoniae]
MKIISIGTNHAGTSFLRTLKTIYPQAELVSYDRNTDISFLGCGIALWVSDEFSDPSGLFYSSPEQLKSMGIDVHLQHDVLEIDRKNKIITVKNLVSGEIFKDSYDKLVFAGGTWPIIPPFEGIDLENILVSKTFTHAKEIKAKAVDPTIKNVIIIGGGYIGIELLEAFHKYGKKTTLIDMQDRIIPNYFDKEFTQKIEDKIVEEGINLQFNQKVVRFIADESGKKVAFVETDKGKYAADLVILAIGFAPNTKILTDVEKTANGAVKVDQFQRCLSDENLYVIGDSASMVHNVTKQHAHIALATNAVKSGIVAAFHIAGREDIPFPGYVGTNAISVFGFNYASTGYCENACPKMGLDNVGVEYLEDWDRPEFMQNKSKVWIKIAYDKPSLKLIGAQIGSYGKEYNHTEVIYFLSLAIQKGLKLPEIALSDFYFLPHYNKPFNFVIQVILNALGLKYNKK